MKEMEAFIRTIVRQEMAAADRTWHAVELSVAVVIGLVTVIVATASCQISQRALESSVGANTIASQANTKMDSANRIAEEASRKSTETAQQVFDWEQQAKVAHLDVLRSGIVEGTNECVVTIQNVGERQAAIFRIECRTLDPDMRSSYAGGDTYAAVPDENLIKTIRVSIPSPEKPFHDFAGGISLAPGAIICLRIRLGFTMEYSELTLEHGHSQRLHLLQIDTRVNQPMDDLFSAPSLE